MARRRFAIEYAAMKLATAVFVFGLSASVFAGRAVAQSGDSTVASLIEPIRKEHNLPALGAALVTSQGVVLSGVAGVRKKGAGVPAAIDDQWHLGSDTKAMTAVVIATFVERGKLTWETTLGEVFPDLAATSPDDFRGITITQLLSHYAGLTANLDWRDIERSAPAVRQQRLNALKKAASMKLTSPPGTKFDYSNLGYTIAGAIVERVGGKSWEDLMQEIVFKPLGMTNCGFGGLGTPGRIDQPWPHQDNGKPMPANGPAVDNPAVIGPAGRVHCSIADWSKFIQDQLRGEHGDGVLLKPETYKALHTPRFGGNYAFGWGVGSRPWAGGTVLQHSGSNTMNFCVVWVAPLRDFAVLAVTNQAGNEAQMAADEAVSALIHLHNK
jgi:CubicO group peptidase (beta-lactamase class C family)